MQALAIFDIRKHG